MSARDGFYVGYRPLPGRHKRFLLLALPLVGVVLIVAGALMAAAQRDPGPAVWDTGAQRSWEGVLLERPFPMVVTDEGRTLMIVRVGKRGVHDLVKRRHAARVRVEGWLLEREGREIIEIDPAQNPIKELKPVTEPPRHETGAEITATGEIVDGKCYLGAMKPGDGKGHKACAILCIRGGLPPLFARTNTDGPPHMYLLTFNSTTDLPDAVLNLVAQPVEVRGTTSRIGSLRILDVASTSDITPR